MMSRSIREVLILIKKPGALPFSRYACKRKFAMDFDDFIFP